MERERDKEKDKDMDVEDRDQRNQSDQRSLYDHASRENLEKLPWLFRFLLKDRWFTGDQVRARQSRWQYSKVNLRADVYGTSLLGVINGFLPSVGLVLVVEDVGGWRLRLRRKWWR
jgi:hypothetical protein